MTESIFLSNFEQIKDYRRVVNPKLNRKLRHITLENKLQVLLIEDPHFNKSAAALDVMVGSLADPEEFPGTAHFLEHMLFIGTKKYPKVDEFKDFLEAHQGNSNAFTASENTNYFFDVNHDAFAESLDRFAQFFVEPLFLEQYVEREKNAVHAEHNYRLKDDYWRSRMILRLLHSDRHPKRKFSTGNLDTLKDLSRAQLLEFYQKNYSANLMRLVIMSPKSLDYSENIVRHMFSHVPNYFYTPPQIPVNLFNNKDLGRVVFIDPVQDIRRLQLVFGLPETDSLWKSKPESLLSHLIGHEGKGSLLSALKKENLVDHLSCWVEHMSFASLLQCELDLTEEGLTHYQRVIEMFFGYIRMLQENPLPDYVIDELRITRAIDYTYKDPREGKDLASHYAGRMQLRTPLQIEEEDQLIHDKETQNYQRLLQLITPRHLNAFVIAKGVQTTEVEPFYQTHYGIKKIPEAQLKQWERASLGKTVHLPEANPFIPKDLTCRMAAEPPKPEQILSDPWGEFWVLPDHIFMLPKGRVDLLIRTPHVNNTPQDKAFSLLYSMLIEEMLGEWSYLVSLAGLHFSVQRIDEGMLLQFSGYAEKLPLLMKEIVSQLRQVSLDPSRFESLKTELKMFTLNTASDPEYQQLFYELRHTSYIGSIHRKEYFDPEANIDFISPITLSELKQYAQKLYQQIAFKGCSYSSLSNDVLQELMLEIPQLLQAKPLPQKLWREEEVIAVPPGHNFEQVFGTHMPNFCWLASLEGGTKTFSTQAIAYVLEAFLSSSFFTDLRTEQQLGYIVNAYMKFYDEKITWNFVVQSPNHTPQEIHASFCAWQNKALEQLAALPSGQFASMVKAAAARMHERPKNFEDMLRVMRQGCFHHKGNIEYRKEIATAIESMDQAQLLTYAQGLFAKDTQGGLFLSMHKEGSKPKTLGLQKIDDLEKFKSQYKLT